MKAVTTSEGWHVLHLFYRVDESGRMESAAQSANSPLQKSLLELIRSFLNQKDFQILTFAMIGHKADIGLMILSPDLVLIRQFEKKLSSLLGSAGIRLAWSYLSMTESSEYTTTPEEFALQLRTDEKLDPASDAFKARLQEFEQRMAKYLQHRLYPQLPPWPVFCFYPMSKRRQGADNWYLLDFAARKKLMEGHARVGRAYSGKILQLITGSTGLDGWEWGVTLLAHDPLMIKKIVYEMRFDPVSASYADFGDFYIGLQVPAEELFHDIRRWA